MVAIPPHVTLSRLIQRMKGKSSSRLLAEFPHLRKWFWGRHVWVRGPFCELLSRVAEAVKSP
jgi:putative transposase